MRGANCADDADGADGRGSISTRFERWDTRRYTYRFLSFALAVLPRTTFAATRRLCALPGLADRAAGGWNGIEDIIGRSNLADRAIFLTLGPIGEQRRSETEFWREFELARPAILGVLLNAAALGLRAMGSVHLRRLPRMADFALWATACETGLWPAGTTLGDSPTSFHAR